jgi:hypothetical protein
MPSVWAIVVRCFETETEIRVDIKPKPVALDHPLTHQTMSAMQSGGKDEYVTILAFNKDNRALVDPGSTLH